VGRDWKRYRQLAEERRASARATAVSRWEGYHRRLAAEAGAVRLDPPETLLAITLMLDPDLRSRFPDSEAVNQALRSLLAHG